MSGSIKDGKDFIKNHILTYVSSKDYRIIDLGCGKGTYGKLLNHACHIDAVDAMPYQGKFNLLRYYNNFFLTDIRNIESLDLNYDMAIIGDVLEHFNIDDARMILNVLEAHVSVIIIAVPYMWKQTGSRYNDYEIHRQPDLNKQVFEERYPEFKRLIAFTSEKRPWHGAEYYAYYEWRR